MAARARSNQEICQARDRALRVLRDRHRAEYDEIYRAQLGIEPKRCRVCGTAVPIGGKRTCGDPFCVDTWSLLRYLVDPNIRADKQVENARRTIRTSTSPARRRHARRVIAAGGALGAREPWVVAHSRVAVAAKTCIDRNLPIAAEMPDHIRSLLEGDR